MRALIPFLVASVISPSAALAEGGAVDTAWELYRGTEFAEAVALLDAAETEGTLTAAEYARSLEIRALAFHALGDHGRVSRSLRLLAAVDPDYVLGPEAGPTLREELDRYRRSGADRAAIRARVEHDGGSVTVAATVDRDGLDLVRRLDVFARLSPDGTWERGERRLVVDAASASSIEYYAEAAGPAGVVVARDGSRDRPLHLDLGGGGLGTGGWLAIAAGGAALVAAAVVLAVVLSPSDDRVAVDGPELPFE